METSIDPQYAARDDATNLKHHTLQLSWPLGLPVIEALILIIIVLGVCELLARTQSIAALLPMQTVGSGSPGLELKLAGLREFVDEHGSVDCIFIGDSTVLRGIDPQMFEVAYAESTNIKIACYNFGVLALSPVESAALSEILVEKYHPHLLIFGTNLRDYYYDHTNERVMHAITDIPWIQYKLGNFSPVGWLTDHSIATQYYLGSITHLKSAWDEDLSKYATLRANGFAPREGIIRYEEVNAARCDSAKKAIGFQIPESVESALNDLVALRRYDVQVVFVELPLHPRLIELCNHGEPDYDLYLSGINDYAHAANVPFVQSTPAPWIDLDGWSDSYHLNEAGAEIFSQWLGRQIAHAITETASLNN